MNGRWGGRLVYAALGAALILLSYWLRNPLLPYAGNTPRASGISSDSAALASLQDATVDTQRKLAQLASFALAAPQSPEAAFDYLRANDIPRGSGVILFEDGHPIAWTGEIRGEPRITATGTSVTFSRFYVSLQVVVAGGRRAAIAATVLHAEPPAERVAGGLDESLGLESRISGFRLFPAATGEGFPIRARNGAELYRADALPLSPEMVRFRNVASARGKGAIILGVGLLLFLAFAWSDRRRLAWRFASLAIALGAIALVPWNNFSNSARIFDPAFFFTPAGGPFTANAGVFALASALLVLAVVALIRGRAVRLSPAVAGLLAFVLFAGGTALTKVAASGIVLPPWGATASLWLTWEVPLFLLLFSAWLASWWLARIAARRRAMVRLSAGAWIAFACGAVAAFIVWTGTTEQRLQLAMRDVAGLERVDAEATQLLSRFGSELSTYDDAGDRADLLKRYAGSDLAAADLQVSLSTWSSDGAPLTRLDLASLPIDRDALACAVRDAIDSSAVILHQVVGPTGQQIVLAAAHRGGGATAVVASPRTRLVARDPYAALYGFEEQDKTEPPYTLTLAEVVPGSAPPAGTMTWRRIDNEWHGDQLIATSAGTARAHVEVDLRSWPNRLVRAALIVMLDVAVAGLLWALSAMSEGAFFRWLRRVATRWIYSYRGRLTLALFTFFVVPAVGFAIWSYQRLQRDDRSARELLVRDVLNNVAADSTGGAIAPAGGAPMFLYSNGLLASSSEPLFELIAPAGRTLPRRVQVNVGLHGELGASARQQVAGSTILWGFRAAAANRGVSRVLAAPARSDELVLDRRRRDLTLLVLFATAVGALAAFWLSGIAARVLARDLELSRIEVARAERVLAWGEMARQVAHEIKNPLTPIRLGVQHLRRARSDPRIDFDRVLDENVTRILSEIDRLDKIARTFTKYGSAPGELPPAEKVDAAAILRDVLSLERMGIGGIVWTLEGAEGSVNVEARADELRDVLLNVFENARLARARDVRVTLARGERTATISIADDGAGISSAALPRVFEPHFSTRTTGSGLGLAISRRLLESWGGSIELDSEEGKGARVLITLQAAES